MVLSRCIALPLYVKGGVPGEKPITFPTVSPSTSAQLKALSIAELPNASFAVWILHLETIAGSCTAEEFPSILRDPEFNLKPFTKQVEFLEHCRNIVMAIVDRKLNNM